jgi:acetyl/propionyl-CoA carboxylase alpha subunit
LYHRRRVALNGLGWRTQGGEKAHLAEKIPCGKLDASVPIRPIKKLLVANRGEIALRIIRTAKIEGIKTVAVFSEADTDAAHVAASDEAVLIGPPEPSQSYLNPKAIIEAALSCGADAIHPGYGFLSERAEFARAVEESGLIFVGPPAEVMAALGDKISARRLAIEAGVPIVPGIEASDLESARAFAQRVQFPILIKASAGGGGRGMRVVSRFDELEASLDSAAREARAAFGDGRVFIEKYLARPRHVEIQILGDASGKIITLGERECSIQRRHQKVIEESPSPAVGEKLRASLCESALRLAQKSGYRNAGTAEFLLDGGEFYFLEVNARLQVEHPVTELRFGCDLVAEQLRIAAGEKLGEPKHPQGWAIECRLTAEDPALSFRPAIGKVLYLRLPSGPGIRIDSALEQGTEITSYYDSLIAKVVSHGATREAARRRMIAALDDVSILGISHSTAFLRDVVASDRFANGDLSTHFVEENFPTWSQSREREEAALIAAALATVDSREFALRSWDYPGLDEQHNPPPRSSPWNALGGFRLWDRR